MSKERSFAKSLASLGGLLDFLQSFIDDEAIAEEDAFAIRLIAEELFTNMVKYSGGADQRILIRVDRRSREATIRLTDFDSDPFDPSSAKAVDVDAPIEERRPGGLGLHFVKSMVDDLQYEFDARKLTVSATRTLED